jgi:hypothetical protein
MGADPENPMKTPSLALLLAAAALASPAAAADPAHRCDVAWLTKAQSTPLGVTVDDPNKYLTAAAGQAPTLDISNPSKLCDATVWRYLAAPAAAGTIAIDPTTHLRLASAPPVWNDANLKQDWAGGLGEQIKILLAVDSLYQIVDGLGRDALTKGDAAADAAVKSGISARKDGAGLDKLIAAGLTGAAYTADKGYELVAAPTVAATGTPMADKTAFTQIVEDVPVAAPKVKPGAKPSPSKPGPKPLKAGAAVVAFRAAIIKLANALAVSTARRDLMQKAGVDGKVKVDFSFSGPKWAATAEAAGANGVSDAIARNVEVFKGASEFITDPKIAAADDDSARAAAALSGLDYGLRNLLALRIAAVNNSVAQAKTLLSGRSVAETLAGSAHDAITPPAATGSATMAAAVLDHLKGNKDYADLAALYDANSAKPEWAASDAGKAVTAQLNSIRADAASARVVKDGAGSALQYTIGGTKVTDNGISVADLDRSPDYRNNMADVIASNIATNPWSAQAQAALAAFRNLPPVVPPLTDDQKKAAALLPAPPISPAVVVGAPAALTPSEALLKATPAQGFLGRLFHHRSSVDRYASKFNADLAATASSQADHRIVTETAANDAADAAAARSAAAREQLAAAPSDPDDSPAVATAKRNAALAAFDTKAALDVKAAHDGVIAADTSYVPAAKAAADLAAKRQALNDTLDAAYSDGISRSVDTLNAEYKRDGSSQRKYAEKKSGYEGQYYKPERVDLYFTTNWGPAVRPAAIASCKIALGFTKDGKSGDFKDWGVDNVDKNCGLKPKVGLRDSLAAMLASYKGSNTTVQLPALPVVPAAVVPATVVPTK